MFLFLAQLRIWWVFCTPEKSRLRWCSLTCIKQSRICPSEFCYGRLFSRCACSQGFSSSLHLFSAITIVFRCLSLRGSLVFRHIKQPHPRYSFSSLTASRKMHWFGTLVNGFMWLFGQKYLSTLREKKKKRLKSEPKSGFLPSRLSLDQIFAWYFGT